MSTLGGSFADVGACLLVVFIHGEVLLRLVGYPGFILEGSSGGWWGRVICTLMCHWITATRWTGAILVNR